MRVESTIYLPHKQYKKIKVRVFHGEVAIDDLKCEQLTVKTMNGKVELSKVNGEKIEVETVNGQVGIAHSNAGKLEVETMNGTIDTAGFYRTIELKSFNGNIVCTLNENGTSRLDAKGITGNIHLLFPKTASVDGEARSNLGSYKLELDGIDVLYLFRSHLQKQVKFKRDEVVTIV